MSEIIEPKAYNFPAHLRFVTDYATGLINASTHLLPIEKPSFFTGALENLNAEQMRFVLPVGGNLGPARLFYADWLIDPETEEGMSDDQRLAVVAFSGIYTRVANARASSRHSNGEQDGGESNSLTPIQTLGVFQSLPIELDEITRTERWLEDKNTKLVDPYLSEVRLRIAREVTNAQFTRLGEIANHRGAWD